MQRKRWLALGVLALGLVSLGLIGGLAAQSAAAGGPASPGDALPVPDGWQALEPGQRAWYAFRYAGDRTPALVRLSASPAGSAAFEIWSPTDVSNWARGDAVSPTGRGSANSSYGGDLIWAGSSPLAGTWFVLVAPAAAAPTWFKLQVAGDGVKRAAPATAGSTRAATVARQTAAAPGQAVWPAATPAAPALQVTQPQASRVATDDPALAYYNPATPTPTRPAQYPADALPLPDGPQTLSAGQHVWYAFQYPGDRSRIAISLHADPAGSANFTVWSWDVLQRWWEGYFY